MHGGSKLLNDTYPDKYRNNIERRARGSGIKIVDSDYVDVFPEPGTTVDLPTRRGNVIKNVDLVVRTTPPPPFNPTQLTSRILL